MHPSPSLSLTMSAIPEGQCGAQHSTHQPSRLWSPPTSLVGTLTRRGHPGADTQFPRSQAQDHFNRWLKELSPQPCPLTPPWEAH